MVSVPKVLLRIETLREEWRGYEVGKTLYFYINGDIVCDGRVIENLGREISPRDMELWFGVRYRE